MNIDRQLGFQLGEWKVYPDQGLLVGVNVQTHLEPKVMEVLVYLAERQDQVARRDDLINDVWRGTFVGDEVLSRAISLLRTSLGDDSTYFSEGLTDELTMTLSKVKGLKVVARRSSYSFKNRIDDVPTIGRLLHADAIFEGTIRRVGDQLRINTQLCVVNNASLKSRLFWLPFIRIPPTHRFG